MTGRRTQRIHYALFATCLFAIFPTATLPEERTADILPVWREVFARPDTSLEAIPTPPGNPLTRNKVLLGERLFSDARLSGDQSRSCASCHQSDQAFTDGLKRAAPRDGKTLLANTPTLINLAWAERFFWDGRATSLEEQARFPIEHPQEMAGSWSNILKSFASDSQMKRLFHQAFPEDPAPTRENIVAALASYQRAQVTPISRFDKFVSGESAALTHLEQEGFKLFVGKAGCVSCHSGWRFTDDRLHLTGHSSAPIKTPTLRRLAHTTPYMHDGSLTSLEEVLAHYQNLSPRDHTLSLNIVRPLVLTSMEKNALIAFLAGIN